MDGATLDLGREAADRLGAARRTRAVAEWEEWQATVDIARELNASVDAEPSALRRLVLRSAIPLTIARRLGLSEGQVSARVAAAERVIARAPSVWSAFSAGRLDAVHIREISAALMKLEEPTSWARLDKLVVDYAERHTVAELRTWLRRFVARAEAERFNARADEERRQRRAEISHGDDGMSWLNLYAPSHIIAAIDRRADAAAKHPAAPDDDRTKAQRKADLVAEWLLDGDAANATLNIDIGVTIPVLSLSGSSGEPAISADGQWAVPTAWALDPNVAGIPFWHRLLVDPVTDDVLTHEYLGRFPPDVLRRALQFRDATCRAPGCTKPADRCDIDHRMPWPEGRTSGDNLWALCRKHHNLKGHGVLRWVLPDGSEVAA